MELRLTGRLTPLEGGGFDVDLTIAGEAVARVPRAATSSTKVAARSDDEVAGEIDRIRELLAEAAPLADLMADLLASENKTGKVATSRLLREIYLPLEVALQKGMTLEALAYGMEAAVAKGVPNVNYAKRAAEGRPEPIANLSPGSGAYEVIGGA